MSLHLYELEVNTKFINFQTGEVYYKFIPKKVTDDMKNLKKEDRRCPGCKSYEIRIHKKSSINQVPHAKHRLTEEAISCPHSPKTKQILKKLIENR